MIGAPLFDFFAIYAIPTNAVLGYFSSYRKNEDDSEKSYIPYTESAYIPEANEICCDFTHIIITDGIDLDSNAAGLYNKEASMAQLQTEYTDVKDVKHQVEHVIVPENDKKTREQLMEELFTALAGNQKWVSA